MRIALCSPEPLGVGGIGTYTGNLARGLSELGHEVRVILPGAPGEQAAARGLTLQHIRVPERYRLPAFNRFFGLTTGFLPWAVKAADAVKRLHAQAPFDVLEVPEWMAGGLFLDDPRLPCIVTRLHTHLALVRRLNGLPMTLDAKLASYLEARALRRAQMVLANSHALADMLSRDYAWPREAIDVLHLGVDLARFKPRYHPELKARLGIPEHHVLALFVGRIEQRKGIDTLMEAFAIASEQVPTLHLAVIGKDTRTGPGETSLRAHLEKRLLAAGSSHRVAWLGPAEHEDLPDFYAGADFLVAPSRLEPFGLVYLEAMATGRPVIATNTGGVPEIVQHDRHGLLVNPEDPRGLAIALVTLASDPGLRRRLGFEGRLHVERHFENGVIAERTVECYQEAQRRRLHATMPTRRTCS